MGRIVDYYNEILTEVGSVDKIDYVLLNNKTVDTQWFLEQAKRIKYDNGFGVAMINISTQIVLKDGSWLERTEYKGSEWFDHKSKPEKKPEIEGEKSILLLTTRDFCPVVNDLIIDGQNLRVDGLRTVQIKEIDGKIICTPLTE